jgi:dipeptidyl aminopeptidase/acylaminoacyl peptidase/pterin-4a-carbinolamine dehydratase
MCGLPVVPESLYDLITVEDPQISPDGRTVAFVQMQPGYQENRYRRKIQLMDIASQSMLRLSGDQQKDSAPRWAPDGKQICFVSTRSGIPQLYLISTTGGEARQLTHMVGGATAPVWSPDGQWLAFLSDSTDEECLLEDQAALYNSPVSGLASAWSADHRESLKDPRVVTQLPYRTGTSFFDGKYHHVYLISVNGGAPKRLTSGMFHHSMVDWSPDSRYVVTNSNRKQSSGDEFFELWSTILKIDIQTGEESVVAFEVAEEGRHPLVSPDGKWVAHCFVPKVESPYAEPYYIAVTPFGGGETSIVSGDDLTVIDFKWDVDSQHLIFLTHDHGDGKLIKVHLDGTIKEEWVTGKRQVTAFTLDKKGQSIAFAATAPLMPSELFVKELTTQKETQLTTLNADWEKKFDLSDVHEIKYMGEGNVEVQGWYMRPRNFDPKKSYPLAVEIHGGPQVMWGNTFWHEFQILAARGYFVFFCNPRGSSGYGANFQRIRYKGGYTDMPDIMTGMDTVISMEKSVDPQRLAVTGGSYGGFLTGWIVTHTDRFKAAVSQRGVYDELNMFGSGDIPESVEWYHGGIPREENLMELWEYSPAAHAKNVVTPLMILHSELDFRVPISQAETFFAALRRHGNRDAVMVRFPREGHELSRAGEPQHRVERLYKIADWFDTHIQPEKFEPYALDQEAFHAHLDEFGGWKLEDQSLIKTYACGNFELAVRFMNQIAAYVKLKKVKPQVSLDGEFVQVKFTDNVIHAPSMAQLALARELSLRVG